MDPPQKKRKQRGKMDPQIGEAVSHVVEFVNEVDDPGVTEVNRLILQATTTDSILVFSFEEVLLDARGMVPEQLCKMLSALNNLGFELVGISKCTQEKFYSKFPMTVNGIRHVRTRNPQETFLELYQDWTAKSVVLFGGENLVPSVIENKRQGDVFMEVGRNNDRADGNLSYLEEMLAMVLVVKAGQSITSLLDV